MSRIYRIKTETGHIFTRHSEADALKLVEARGGEITVYVELEAAKAMLAKIEWVDNNPPFDYDDDVSVQLAVENSELRFELAAVKAQWDELLSSANNINLQLRYFMEGDACANDPHASWPETDCDGCAYCSARADIDKFNSIESKIEREASS